MIPRFRSSCKSRAADCRGGISPEDVENLLEQHSHGDSLKPHALRDFLASRFPDYCRSHPVTEEKLKVMNSLLSCKTAATATAQAAAIWTKSAGSPSARRK